MWALLATAMTFAHNFRAAFIFLVVATFVDSTDGVLARAFRVKELTPEFDGALLDNIIDYMTFVFVPALIVWQADLVPVAFPVCAAMLMSSAYGFAHSAAKIESHDHFFTGFPSYWNIVAVYLYILQMPKITNAIILVILAVLVFVPLRYVYPSRTRTLQIADVDPRCHLGGALCLDDLPAAGHRRPLDGVVAGVPGLVCGVVAVAPRLTALNTKLS